MGLKSPFYSKGYIMFTYRLLGGLTVLLGMLLLIGGNTDLSFILLGVGVFFAIVVPELRARDRADEE